MRQGFPSFHDNAFGIRAKILPLSSRALEKVHIAAKWKIMEECCLDITYSAFQMLTSGASPTGNATSDNSSFCDNSGGNFVHKLRL